MENLIQQAFDPEAFRSTGHELIDVMADYLQEALSGRLEKVNPWESPEAQLQYWQSDYAKGSGQAPLNLFREVLARSVHLHSPRYVGHQVSPTAPLAALGSLLSSMLNNGMAVYEMGAVSTALERLIARETARRLGLGEAADGFLTSGGSLANLTALLTARNIRGGGSIWQSGQEEPLALMVSEEAHYCVDRAARIMGWGEEGIVKVPVDEQYCMRTDLLEYCLKQARDRGRRVVAVVGSACSTSTGAFDDLEAIGAFCRRHQLWFHVDGAHGAALALSRKYRHLVKGIEQADSVTVDFHKMMLAPTVTTALLFRESKDSYATFHQQGQYLWSRDEEEEWYNIAKRSFECTKLMMSLRVYPLLRSYGWDLFEQYIDQVIDLTYSFAERLRRNARFELAVDPSCNIICFRLKAAGLTDEELDILQNRIRQSLLEQGRFYLVQTRLRGRSWLRCTFTNPFTTIEDLEELLDLIIQQAAQV